MIIAKIAQNAMTFIRRVVSSFSLNTGSPSSLAKIPTMKQTATTTSHVATIFVVVVVNNKKKRLLFFTIFFHESISSGIPRGCVGGPGNGNKMLAQFQDWAS